MLSNFIKAQLDSLAARMAGTFGMVNDSGEVLYCAGGEVAETDSLFKGYLSSSGDLFAGDYFCLGDYIFYPVDIQGEDAVFLFLYLPEAERDETDKAHAARLLSVAAYALADQEIRHERRLSELFRRLMSESRKGILRSEIEDVCGSGIVKGSAFRLLLVTEAEDLATSEKEAVRSVVQNLFAADLGYLCVQADAGRMMVICPVDTEEAQQRLDEYAQMVSDTVMAEAMVIVRVSVSSIFTDIMDVGLAFQQADRARNIGEVFDLPQKCYHYDALGLEKLIFSFPAQACVDYVRETLGPDFLQDRSAGELLLTVQTFLDCNQNGSEAARVLYIHRNTMMYRLEKFNRLTGLDCAQFNTGLRIRMAMLILRYLEKREPGLLKLQK